MSATVLVVDDLLPNVKLLEAKLTSEYYDVLTARSGFEAIQIAQEKPIDIILLDVMMPDMDGFETCRQLKANPKTTHIPVVMVTALSEIEDRVQGLQAGADDFLTKPINDTALFARIRSLVRLKIMLDELRLRDQTGLQFGITVNPNDSPLKDVSGARIVVIDDDTVQAKHIASKLSTIQNSYVKTIFEPQSAFEDMVGDNFDLAIISTQLTNFDGLRLCSHIRSNEQIRHLPILVLVEESDTRLLVKALDMGVNDYIVVPVEGNELLARVITQIRRKRYQDALKSNYQNSLSMAVTDSLTGLYNRRYFDAHCKTLLDETRVTGKPLALLVVDIDHFKQVNDTYGHITGDEILKQTAARITHGVRVTDLVARYGGEEFVIVMPNTELKDAQEVAERLRESVETVPFPISAQPGTLTKTISIGVTAMRSSDTSEILFSRADKGLYIAKESGRNQVVLVNEP